MTSPLPVALALLASVPSAQEVELTADRLVSEPGRQVLTGHAVLRTDDAVVRADEIVFSRSEQSAVARGRVTAGFSSGGLFAAVADSVSLRLEGRQVKEVFLRRGRIMQKTGVTPEQLFAAATPEAIERLGHTSMTLSGTHLFRGEGERWTIDDLSLSPCGCAPGEAGLRVAAPRARVDLESRRASIDFPTVYVKSVPVFWLPWLSLPLSTRASGLLVPRPTWAGQNGLGLELPFFLTLGRSYDVTLTPGYFTGSRSADPSAAGVAGPRLHTELRYAPSELTSGKATLGLLYDLRGRRNAATERIIEGAPPRGLRAEGSLLHSQELGGGWHDRVDAAFVSDGAYPRDLSADIFVRENGYLRSNGSLFHRGDELFAGLEVGLLQDLKGAYRLFGSDLAEDGVTRLRAPSPLHRLPAIVVSLAERPLVGPVHGGFRAEYSRHAPILQSTGDEVLADGRLQPGEREARDRLDLRPRLSASLRAGTYARLTPYAAFREDLYVGEVTGKTSQRGYPIGGLILDSELWRTFGEGPLAWRHSLSPSFELRYVPFVLGSEPAPYDDIDSALPSGGRLLQAVAELRQQLLRREGLAGVEVVRLDLGQGLDLDPGGPRLLRDSYARLAFFLAPVNVFATARLDLAPSSSPPSRPVASLSAGFSIDGGRGDALFASYDRLSSRGSDQTLRGIDALFGPRPLAAGGTQEFAEQLVAGIRTRPRLGVALEYQAVFSRFQFIPDSRLGLQSWTALSLRQQRLALSFAPACDCWRVEAYVLHSPNDGRRNEGKNPYLVFPNIGASLTLGGFGTFGAGG